MPFTPLLLLASLLLLPPGPAPGQDPLEGPGPSAADTVDFCVAHVPFGVGERMGYQARAGPLPVGEAVVGVTALEAVRGHPAYRLDWVVQGGIPLFRIHDHYQSWMDVQTLASRRFIQDIHQGRRERLRHFELHPEERRYDWVGVEEGLELLSDRPLDDLSFVFYLRSIPLGVGEVHTFHRYFRAHGNPVSVEVLRKEEVTVPAGTYPALVIRPIVRSGGLWDENADAEVHLSDDEERRVLQLRFRLPVVGSLTLQLTDYVRGGRLEGTC